ncbi:DUF4241 domain-containing protein [Hymenobacter sp. ISL-91]|uniref:DUF4241 domain-containing protein n=1 Tax=Hymenobacter sp. ISL-91 TaxID=2819151 RepID=UPI001BE51089|nr:DUF4241 domain-containing protein [Hymenobacter sp. ISL-91]MBT2557581.1 DUF4241 domain-containing protein [Hymenobacter sp. ISL-91]
MASPSSQEITRLAYSVSAQPKVFETSFFPGTTIQHNNITFRFTRTYLGDLPVPTGRIVVTDPILLESESLPFTTVFPKGDFPVELAIAHFGDDERVAFARILFSAEPVAAWTMALLAGQKPLPITGEEYYGYSVDSGSGLFIDSTYLRGFNQYLSADNKNFSHVFTDYLAENQQKPGILYTAQGNTLATFSTGLGDGYYATYIGFDAQHRPCRLLTDFQLIKWQ